MSQKRPSLSRPADSATIRHGTFAATLRRGGERIKDALLYSSAYLAVIAAVEVATVMAALSLPPNPAPLVVGLVTFAVYAGDRIADADTDELDAPERTAFVRRHETALSVLSAASYGLAVAIAVAGGPFALAITLLPGAFWILYATDWLPALGSTFKRLKDVLVVNSAVVAGAWAIALLFLPLAFADAAVTPTAAVVFVYFFLDTFVNTEIPNVADVAGDAAIGVSTMPVVFGVRRTRQILYALDVALIAFLVAAFYGGLLSTSLTIAAVAGLGYALVLAALVGRTDDHGRLGVAGEAKHLFVFAVLLALTGGGL
ncbi:UbiA family prenyltransferase [Haloplanus pelagicus]|uniref:UbiA family prenyltransferase n=1 Tax=Haloplanus pelagicus TaxID=2949995 RepID=UPI00203D6417|nr:UbiA family prenyltransferase [Haloplanus sp. HW8-1]